MKPKFSMGTLSDNVDNAKSCQRKLFILQFAAQKNSSPDRKDIYIIKEDNWIIVSFHQFDSHSVHSEDHFSEEGLFEVRFPMSSFSEQKWTTMNKNVRFISGNFSSERFSWKVKTIRCGLYILINKHQRYWCLEFTILKRTWPIFAETLISFSLEFRPKPFVYVPHKWLWSKILTNSFLWINKN